MIDRETYRARLVAAKLDPYVERLVALARPSIRLESQRPVGDIPLGASRLGGRPDLPDDVAWPTFRGTPMAFVAQIDLASLRDLAGSGDLPPDGLLSCFFAVEQQVWGNEPEDRGGWRVLYAEAGRTLRRRALPAALHDVFGMRRLDPRAEWTFAPDRSFEVGALAMTDDEEERFWECLEPTTVPAHRLGGHPDLVQNEMRLLCELAANGLDPGDERSYEPPHGDEHADRAADWTLLLQVDSDEAAGMMWADLGRIYYWIRREDLAHRRFDRVWCVLQCH